MNLIHSLLFACCLISNTHAATLPTAMRDALHQAHIPLDAVAIEVREASKHSHLISLNAQQAMNPASTMKLLTTYAGLEILGPAYRWKTEAYLDGKLENGVLYGNLVFKGYGDPKLTLEEFWLWLRELRQRGLREIRGDIVLDTQFFAEESQDPSAFDNKPARAYNVAPNALLLNFNALHLRLLPNGHDNTPAADIRHDRSPHPDPAPRPTNGFAQPVDSGSGEHALRNPAFVPHTGEGASIPSPQSSPASGRGSERENKLSIPERLREFHDDHTTALLEPELYGYQLDNRTTTSANLPCNGEDTYHARLNGQSIVLEGSIPDLCGEAQDYFSPLPHNEYFFAVFAALWRELGGQIQGRVRTGSVPDSQIAFSTHLSPPLSEVIRDINKFSNNVMARQLFLTLGAATSTPTAKEKGEKPKSQTFHAIAERADHPLNIQRSTVAIRQWLGKQQLQFPELILENGAGLSRTESISAQHLADILQRAAGSQFSAELEASLPILGMDGTVKRRFKGDEIAGHAHLKTGSLEGVKSIAGYVHARSGRQWIMVFIINHPNAKYGQPAQDALIEWLQKLH